MAISSFGPVDVVAVAFPSERVPDAVQAAVREVLTTGTVTLLDLAVVRRSPDGAVEILEIADLGDVIELTDVELGGAGLAGEEDLTDIADDLVPGSSAVVLVVEHTWARGLVGTVRDAGGIVLVSERIPAEVVNEVADLVLDED